MTNKPEKCLTCNHAVVRLENEHKGMCKFEMEAVVRCDLSGYKVGCVCAEMYCDKKEEKMEE